MRTKKKNESEILLDLISRPVSEQTAVDGTTDTETQHNIKDVVFGLDFVRRMGAAPNPFGQLHRAKTVPPGACD